MPHRPHHQPHRLGRVRDTLGFVRLIRQQPLGRLVGDTFHAEHQLAPPHIADQRQVAQRTHPRLKVPSDPGGIAQKVLAFHDLDVLQARRTRHRMPRIGEPGCEPPGAVAGHRLPHPVRNDQRAQGHIARGQPLGGADHVRLDAELRKAGEPVPQPPKGRHHLIGDEQDVMALTHLPHPAQITLWRDDHPARGLDRLGNEAADAVRPHPRDQRLELRHQSVAERRLGHALGAAVGVRHRQVMDPRLLVAELRHPVAGALAHRLRKVGRAVIAVIPRHDVGLLRAPHAGLVIGNRPHRRIHRRRSARREHHPVQVTRREVRQFGRQARGRVVGHVDKSVRKRQPFRLIGNRLRHFLPAQPDIGAPKPAHRIEIPPPVGIPQMAPLTARDHQRTFALKRAKVRPGVQRMRSVHLPQIGGRG